MPAAEIEAGQTAYDRVAAFAALRRRRLGLIYALLPILLLVAAAGAWRYGQKALGIGVAVCALIDALGSAWYWRRLVREDVHHRELLARLHAQYGDDLPWLEAERQMAEIRRIQAEEAIGRATRLRP